MTTVLEKIPERFWAKVDKNGPLPAQRPSLGRCWLWTGGTAGWGHGVYWRGDRQVYAHRFMLEARRGRLPKSRRALHKCDVPRCVRLAHLYSGTLKDNTRDMVSRRRYGWLTHPEQRPIGERNPKSKLSKASVRQIRRLYNSGVTQVLLASRFGVTQGLIGQVCRRELWTHVV